MGKNRRTGWIIGGCVIVSLLFLDWVYGNTIYNPDTKRETPLESILDQQEHTSKTTSLLLEQVSGVPPEQLSKEPAVWELAASSDPEAVEFTIGLLKNPRVGNRVRERAYHNLASNGGRAGLAAVLAERHTRRLLPSLIERMEFEDLVGLDDRIAMSVLIDKRTQAGRTWGLVRNRILGDYYDLWVVEEVDGEWARPLFTGARLPDDDRFEFDRYDDRYFVPEKFYGKTAQELLDGAWFETLVGNVEIERDTDGDGLTDLMEKRLSTDPEKADTDGDGDSDLVDPWPNAAPRELSDDEQVIAAIFEAYFHFSGFDGSADVSSYEFTPFEMPGWQGQVLWFREDEWIDRLGRFIISNQQEGLTVSYSLGTVRIRFYEVTDQDGESFFGKPTGNLIRWNSDRTEASIMTSHSAGHIGSSGHLVRVKKFGDQWVVVQMGG